MRVRALLAAGLVATPSLAGTLDPDAPIHPCRWFDRAAHRTGLDSPETAMALACTAISERRAAGLPLSDRLLAAEMALIAYRDAVEGARQAARARGAPSSAVDPATLPEREAVAAAMEGVDGGW